ncbi:DoxX family protein [Nevskia soli]|jgi:putative oxidoreductase|uniref:DoxX family protein n=1 Tax=Nevskia soli TaxID=418856 RepID=UPI0015D8E212|nr:DoxX family protein [Nevskia soli]
MFSTLIRTLNDPAMTIARLTLGIVFFVHGAQKVLGWFGGQGLAATYHGFTQFMHIPAVFAVLAIAAEFLGGLGLIVGFLTRIAAFGILCEMLVAVFKFHLPNGFFMNWTGQQKGEGFEYHLLAIALAAVIMIRGAGAVSIDRALSGPEYRTRRY